MPRKPSAAIPRSETTAELIARISAERDAPPSPGHSSAGRSRAGVLDAPEVTRRPTTRGAGLPRQRSAADTRRSRTAEERPKPPALPRPRDAGRVTDLPTRPDRDRPDRDVRTGPPSGRRALRSVVADDVDPGPEPDDTPTVVIGYLEPIAPRKRSLARRFAAPAIATAALIGISIAIAQGFTFPGYTDPADATPAVLVDAPAPDPAPTGPTVPAPADSAPADPAAEDAGVAEPADEPAADPQSDVTVTDAAVPADDYSY
ncbi:hypothetical protein [Pseudonocardia sp.]|uniref:hypothetical protein n=1 Tax=Pseudonocardia sp. TaxID=60912 RepID=UPI002628BBAD|nr:hypothetical protein [Pseudonocardia sp.]